jgi:hypothetical protein
MGINDINQKTPLDAGLFEPNLLTKLLTKNLPLYMKT